MTSPKENFDKSSGLNEASASVVDESVDKDLIIADLKLQGILGSLCHILDGTSGKCSDKYTVEIEAGVIIAYLDLDTPGDHLARQVVRLSPGKTELSVEELRYKLGDGLSLPQGARMGVVAGYLVFDYEFCDAPALRVADAVIAFLDWSENVRSLFEMAGVLADGEADAENLAKAGLGEKVEQDDDSVCGLWQSYAKERVLPGSGFDAELIENREFAYNLLLDSLVELAGSQVKFHDICEIYSEYGYYKIDFDSFEITTFVSIEEFGGEANVWFRYYFDFGSCATTEVGSLRSWLQFVVRRAGLGVQHGEWSNDSTGIEAYAARLAGKSEEIQSCKDHLDCLLHLMMMVTSLMEVWFPAMMPWRDKRSLISDGSRFSTDDREEDAKHAGQVPSVVGKQMWRGIDVSDFPRSVQDGEGEDELLHIGQLVLFLHVAWYDGRFDVIEMIEDTPCATDSDEPRQIAVLLSLKARFAYLRADYPRAEEQLMKVREICVSSSCAMPLPLCAMLVWSLLRMKKYDIAEEVMAEMTEGLDGGLAAAQIILMDRREQDEYSARYLRFWRHLGEDPILHSEYQKHVLGEEIDE